MIEIKTESDLDSIWPSFSKAVEDSGIYAIDIETKMGTCPKLPEILLLGDHRCVWLVESILKKILLIFFMFSRGTVLIVHLNRFTVVKNDGRMDWILGEFFLSVFGCNINLKEKLFIIFIWKLFFNFY